MRKPRVCRMIWLGLPLALVCAVLRAQDADPEDAMIDQIRRLPQVGPADQERIARWVEKQVDTYTGIAPFRLRFTTQFTNRDNTPEFGAQFAAQTATVAGKQFEKANLRPGLAVALAQVLSDLDRSETQPGLLACLKATDAGARYVCVTALTRLRDSTVANPTTLGRMIQSLQQAGLAESESVVLGRIYEALAMPGQVAGVFDAYLSLFDNRLEQRRTKTVTVDGAEICALEFFRTGAVLGAINADQKAQLAGRLAVFVRMDAQRYQVSNLGFDEIDRIERTLDGAEEILDRLVGAGAAGGKIRDALSAGARDAKQTVLQQAYRWVGHPETQEPGVLNAAPWNVPVGAP